MHAPLRLKRQQARCGYQASDSPRYCRSLIVTGLITVGTKNSNAMQSDISLHCVAQMLSFGCRMKPMQATLSCLHSHSIAHGAHVPHVAGNLRSTVDGARFLVALLIAEARTKP
jgi:hypothetical protein